MANDESSINNNHQTSNNVSSAYNDPYLISSLDQTISKLVPANLNGNNYMSWKRNVRRALVAKNKLGFLDGTIHKPDLSDKEYNWWMRCDYLSTSWLINSMNAYLLADNFTYVDNFAQHVV